MNRHQHTKSVVIEASKEVFKQRGYNDITMDDIAKACGKGRSTLYHYFKNKEEVFEEWAMGEFFKLYDKAAARTSSTLNLEHNLQRYYEAMLIEISMLIKEYPKLHADLKMQDAPLLRIQSRATGFERKKIKQLLEWAVENKEIRPKDDRDMDYLSLATVTALASLNMEMILFGSVEDLTSKLFWIISILVKGLQ